MALLQPVPNQLVELRLFYQAQNDNNIYHVTCKKIYLQESDFVSWDEDNYDYEFFFQSSADDSARYHVTCKLLPHSLVVNLLNKEIYGVDFDVNDLKRSYLLTLYQKLNLEQNLKQILPLYFSQHSIPDDDSHENLMINNHIIQNYLSTQILQLNELGLFYQTQNDSHFYHVTCKIILQDYLQNSKNSNVVSWDDENYDYEFFFQSSDGSTMIYHVTCKLLSHSVIVNILNKEIYGMRFDGNDLKRKYLLTLHQKLNLEQNLKQILPLCFEASNENSMIMQTCSMADNR